jgi:hypothetical protein
MSLMKNELLLTTPSVKNRFLNAACQMGFMQAAKYYNELVSLRSSPFVYTLGARYNATPSNNDPRYSATTHKGAAK